MSRDTGHVRFTVLGPLGVSVGGRRVRLNGPRQERVLAALLVDQGRVVPMARLIDAAWDDDPPATARRQVQDLVSRLRRLLRNAGAPADLIRAERDGYVITLGAAGLDLVEFDALVAEADAAGTDPLPLLRGALDVWSGPALPGVSGGVLRWTADTLDERRAAVWQRCLELEMASGDGSAVTSELFRFVEQYPYREGPVTLLVEALRRTGRRADALEVLRRHRQRLADDLGLDPGPAVADLYGDVLDEAGPPVPAQLPVDLRGFTGRAGELATLDRWLAEATEEGTALLAVVCGTGGVGKTALVVHWARQRVTSFPDGQLYADLRGFGPDDAARTADDVVRTFLVALGVTQDRMPADADARFGLFRTLVAGRRALFVLDNARSPAQVRPLLVGAAGTAVLVTSRNRLGGLVAAEGARPVRLDVLRPPEARLLLARRLGARRVDTQPEAVEVILRRCAYLPLALAIVAGHAGLRPGLPLAALAEQLSDPRGRMRVLAGGDDAATNLAAVFSWSYRHLDADSATLFRLLGLHPGLDVTPEAAASLAGLPVPATRTLLDRLADAHLVTEHVPGRFRSHDLLHAYAARLAADDPGRPAAQRRMFDHYLHTAHAADRLLQPHRDPMPLPPAAAGCRPEPLADDRDALAWYGAEHATLLAVVARAAAVGADGHVWRIAWTLHHHLDRRGHWQDWADVMARAVDAARRLDDPAGEARALRALGGADIRLGRFEEARQHLVRTLDLYRGLGDRAGQGAVHHNLAIVFDSLDRPGQALRHAEQALTFSDALHPATRAHTLNAIGWYHTRLGDHETALARCGAALAEFESLHDGTGQAFTLDSLGLAYVNLGRYGEATEHYARALTLYRDLGDRPEEADTLDHLGDAAAAAGDRDRAERCWREALGIFEELGNPAATLVRAKIGPRSETRADA